MLALLERPGFLIVMLIGILIFGAKRLPDSARALGRSMRILKAETKGLTDSDTTVEQTEQPAQPAQPAITPPVLHDVEPVAAPQPINTRTAS